MKKLLLIFTLLCFATIGKAQLGVTKGLSVGTTGTGIVNISNAELKTLDGINTASTLKDQFDAKLDVSDTIDLETVFYTETEVNALITSLKINPVLRQLKLMGSPIKAIPMYASVFLAGSNLMYDGDMGRNLFEVTETITVTGVGYILGIQGSYTADNYNGIALYSISGTTATKIVETANDGDIWKISTGTPTLKAFPTTYVLTPGLYAVTFVWNNSASVTSPALGSWGGLGNGLQTLNGNIRPGAYIAGQTALPATINLTTGVSIGSLYGIWLY